MISIIIPVYKVEDKIRSCIDSVLKQSYTDWELLLIDDGSPDKSGEICDEYAKTDMRIKVLHKKNGGVSSARNYGLDNAEGEWIVFIDSDDYVESSYLEDFFREYQPTSNSIVIQGMFFDKSKSQTVLGFPNKVYESKDIGSGLIENNLFTYGGPCCKLYRASLIKQNNIKFPTNYSYGEDTVFFLKYLSFIDSLILVSSCNYHYIEWNQDSLSHKSHRFEELKSYVEDNLSAIKKLDDCFTSSDLLMRSHGNSIDGLMKKMLLDVYRLGYNKTETRNIYKEIKNIINKFSCQYYSKVAKLLFFTPTFMYGFLVRLKK